MKLVPLGDRVLVEREPAEEKTAGGILLPDNAKEKPQIGKVVAVGDGRTRPFRRVGHRDEVAARDGRDGAARADRRQTSLDLYANRRGGQLRI